MQRCSEHSLKRVFTCKVKVTETHERTHVKRKHTSLKLLEMTGCYFYHPAIVNGLLCGTTGFVTVNGSCWKVDRMPTVRCKSTTNTKAHKHIILHRHKTSAPSSSCFASLTIFSLAVLCPSPRVSYCSKVNRSICTATHQHTELDYSEI